MINADLPIKSCKDDVLGRETFSNNIAKAILNFNKPDSFTIGLYGRWGSGKTSVINMIIERITELSETMEEKQRPVLLNFNPWCFSDQNQLISQFFKQLSSALNKDILNEKLKFAGETIEKYSDAFNIANIIPNIGIIGTILAFLGKTVGKGAQRLADAKNADIIQIKNKINDILSKQNAKVIIVIDDIDRLTKIEIRQIFQLVKSLADFSNTIYMLSFDRDVVVDALKDVQKGDGSEYLEKVVQVPFELPIVSSQKIYKCFFQKIDEIISDLPQERFNGEYWGLIFNFGIKSLLNTIRDVTRVTNTLSLKYVLLKDETNVIDLIATTVIQVFMPETYAVLSNFKDQLCGGNNYSLSNKDEKAQTKAACDMILETAKSEKKENLKQLLCYMFPKVASAYNVYSAQNYDNFKTREEAKICNPSCFNLYFQLTLEENQISKVIVEYMLFKADRDELIKKFSEINQQGKIIDFIDLSRAILKGLKGLNRNIERVPLLIETLFMMWNSFSDTESQQFWGTPFVLRLLFITDDLLKIYSDESLKFQAIKKVFLREDIDLHLLVSQILTFEHEYGRFSDKQEKTEEKLLSLAHVEELEQILLDRMNNIASTGKISHELFKVLYFWDNVDKESKKKYILSIIADDEGLSELIGVYISQGKVANGTVQSVWTVDLNGLDEFIDVGEAYKRMNQFISTERFNGQLEEIKFKIGAFLIHHERGSDFFHDIRRDDINKRLDLTKE